MSQQKEVRVRFAPSPTGMMHIGNLRAGLFNWLFAKHTGGKFLVRIEDTDRERSKPAYVDAIIDSLRWMGIESDEPLLFQSQRLSVYNQVLHQLLETGCAYRCYCTPEEIAARRACVSKHSTHDACSDTDDAMFLGYDGYCRHRSLTEADVQKPYVIRFAVPQDVSDVSFQDAIRGNVSVSLDQFDDFIIARSDGWPIYNFVVVVDDAAMRITHVIRGEDHITNTCKQLLLYRACGYQEPVFAHLPLILGPSGDKLSKRDGATSVPEYQRMGFLPDALFNYLVRLGWAHGDQEVFSRAELITLFSLDAVGKKGAIFDIQKLTWLNGVYIRMTSEHELLERIATDVMPTIRERLYRWDTQTVFALIALYKERVKTLQELAQELVTLHDGPTLFVSADIKQWVTPDSAKQLAFLIQTLDARMESTLELIQSDIKAVAKQLGVRLVVLAQPLRIALVGKSASPGVFELVALLGKEETLRRMRAFIDFLQQENK